MMAFRAATRACVLGLVVSGATSVVAQERSGGARLRTQADAVRAGVDPLSGSVITGAPFSGDTATTVTQTLGDGTHIEQRVTSKLYRDGTGRVRREQTIIGLDQLNPATEPQTIITFDSVPGDPMPYVLDPVAKVATRTGRAFFAVGDRLPIAWTTNTPYGIRLNTGDATGRELERAVNQLRLGGISSTADPAVIPGDLRPTEEQLGTRQMEGVKVVGRRTTTVIPLGRIGNDAPIRVVDERWESPELNVTVYSRFSDPRTGVVEYRLTSINRAEPRADLFAVPSDYTVRDSTPGARRGRTAAPGERGGRSEGQRGGRSPQ